MVLPVLKAYSLFSVLVSYDEIEAKNCSFSAGQYFDVKVEHVAITPKQFETELAARRERLEGMFNDARKLEVVIERQLCEGCQRDAPPPVFWGRTPRGTWGAEKRQKKSCLAALKACNPHGTRAGGRKGHLGKGFSSLGNGFVSLGKGKTRSGNGFANS